jgi:hypothetical protein
MRDNPGKPRNIREILAKLEAGAEVLKGIGRLDGDAGMAAPSKGAQQCKA